MAADLDDLRRTLERQWRDLEARTPLWEEEPDADVPDPPSTTAKGEDQPA